MRVHGLTVGRNEAGRYLLTALQNNMRGTDTFTFYDDRSTDDTAEIVLDLLHRVYIRDEDRPSFLEHEGQFRQDAYDHMCAVVKPEPGDWILSIDCDEILCTVDETPLWDAVRAAIANAGGANAVLIPIPECFGRDPDDGWPLVRTDGWWGKVRGTRLYRWQPNGTFSDKAMGSGSEPTYAVRPPHGDAGPLRIMHLGYSRPEDVRAKYERYNALEHGHNDRHIQSIIQTPTLERWDGAHWNINVAGHIRG